jgi:hypothetical protein
MSKVSTFTHPSEPNSCPGKLLRFSRKILLYYAMTKYILIVVAYCCVACQVRTFECDVQMHVIKELGLHSVYPSNYLLLFSYPPLASFRPDSPVAREFGPHGM